MTRHAPRDPTRPRSGRLQLPGFKVGIAWQGNRHFQWDRWRSIPLEQFAPLAAVEGVRLVSLQKVFGTEQLGELRGGFQVTNFTQEMDEKGSAFVDTAAV